MSFLELEGKVDGKLLPLVYRAGDFPFLLPRNSLGSRGLTSHPPKSNSQHRNWLEFASPFPLLPRS